MKNIADPLLALVVTQFAYYAPKRIQIETAQFASGLVHLLQEPSTLTLRDKWITIVRTRSKTVKSGGSL